MVDSERLRKAVEEFRLVCTDNHGVCDYSYPVDHSEMRKIAVKLVDVLNTFIDELSKDQ